MQTLPNFWPGDEECVTMAGYFEHYGELAYGMCYIFGYLRRSGMTCADADRTVRWSVEDQTRTCPIHGKNPDYDPS